MLLTLLPLLLPVPQVQEPAAPVPEAVAPKPRKKGALRLHVEPLDFDPDLGKGRFPVLSADGVGKIHMCWFAPKDADGAVALKSATWDGNAWSEPLGLARGKGWLVNWADFAKFQADADGAAVVSWQAFAADGKGYGVMYRKRREAGAAWTDPMPLHVDRTAVEHGFVSLSALGEGRFFANWLQSTDDGPPTALRGVVLGSDGLPGNEFVLDDRVCDCCSTASVLTQDGKVVVAYRDRSEEEIRDIHVVRGDPMDPESWSDPVSVGGERWLIQGCPVNGPAMASDGSLIVLAYYTQMSGGEGSVKYVVSRDDGKRFGFAGVFAGGPDCLGRVSVAFLPDGGPAILSWLERDGDTAVWKARALPRQGKRGPEVEIARVSGARKDGFLQLATGPTGVVAAWTGDDGKSVKTARLRLWQEVKAEMDTEASDASDALEE